MTDFKAIAASLEEWKEYKAQGLKRALEIGNRGPLRLGPDGRMDQQIVRAYQAQGYYVFEDMVSKGEVAELVKEFDEVLDNAPINEGGITDRHGCPCRFPGYMILTDPPSAVSIGRFNGTGLPSTSMLAGEEVRPGEEQIVTMLSHPLMYMDSAVRLYGHPNILELAEGLNGTDFVPFNETIHHKGAGNGAATVWHQDGKTHWDEQGRALENEDIKSPAHGINCSVAITQATPENCLWVLPGSHSYWRLHNGGSFPPISDRLPGAVPMVLRPGDVGVVSRSSLHGSYPNRSEARRVTVLLGFHRRSSAVGVTVTKNIHASMIYGQEREVTYTEDWVNRRSRMIPLAIDARRQWYPQETPYVYKGITDGGNTHWGAEARAEMSKEGDEYWTRNITL